MTLLESREIQFLDSCKESTNVYITTDMVSDMLIRCTNNRMKRDNFITQFSEFLPCIQNKMFKISTTTPSNFTTGTTKKRREEISLPPLINLEDISNAIRQGYDYLKPMIDELVRKEKINPSDFDKYKTLAIQTVLVIIARASLERRFE